MGKKDNVVYIKDFLSDEEILEEISEGMGYDSPDDLRNEVDSHLNQERTENSEVDFLFQGNRDSFLLSPRSEEAVVWVWDMLAIPPWEQACWILIPNKILDMTLAGILYVPSLIFSSISLSLKRFFNIFSLK